jgi:hypothetical protein
MSDSWNVLSARLTARLNDLASRVLAARPDAWSAVHAWPSNEFVLLSVHASFGRGDRATALEDVVVSVQAHVKDDALRLSADIARGAGEVMAEGPTRVLSVRDAEREALIASWCEHVEAFLAQADASVVDCIA